MGRSITVEIAGRTFPSMGEFKAYLHKLLQEQNLGVPLEGENHLFLCHLVRRHPESADKIGAGIKQFKVLTNSNHGGKTRCFFLFRVDGTFTTFSYQKCCAAPSPWVLYLNSLRTAVMDQIIMERENAFGKNEEILCPVRKISVTKSAIYVEHLAPDTYEKLVERFNDEEWLHEEAPPQVDGSNLSVGFQLMDMGLAERWKYFHKTNARMRVISHAAVEEKSQ